MATASMSAFSRGVGDPVACALPAIALPFSIAGACRRPPNGFPHWLIAIPQCAIAQLGSVVAIASNILVASGNQNECSSATALLKSSLTPAAQDVSNFTLALPI